MVLTSDLSCSMKTSKKYSFSQRLLTMLYGISPIRVLPDIVYLRWLNSSRFYSEPRSVAESLWWYIHLSWQGTVEETLRIL